MSSTARTRVRVGAIWLPQFPPERLLGTARSADNAGLAELWLWEDCFLTSGVASAAAVLAATTDLRVGLGLLPVPLRNPALTAMELATLHRMFPGRLLAGIGHGVQDWMGQVGARVDSPLTLLREHAEAVRRLLDGERVSVRGRYVTLDDVQLAYPCPGAPLLGGAGGPRTLRLTGEVCDGTILSGGTTPAQVREARRLVDQGQGLGELTVFLLAATGAGSAERLRACQDRWGFAVSEETGVAGDADDVADAVRRWARAGADRVVLQPTEDEPDVTAFLGFVAEHLQPQLH